MDIASASRGVPRNPLITAWVGLEGALKLIPFQPPAMGYSALVLCLQHQVMLVPIHSESRSRLSQAFPFYCHEQLTELGLLGPIPCFITDLLCKPGTILLLTYHTQGN